jgi:hypothetical protein
MDYSAAPTVGTRQHGNRKGPVHEGRPAPCGRLRLFPRPVLSRPTLRARRAQRFSRVCGGLGIM